MSQPDATPGDTPEERLARHLRAQRRADALGIIGLLVPGAALLSSHPALIAALLAMPWLALWLARRLNPAASADEGEGTTVLGDFFPALFMSAIGLTVIALKMSNLEDWLKIIAPAVAAAVVMLALVAWAVPRMFRHPAALAAMGPFLFIYAASTLAIANLYLDTAAPNDVVLDVTGKFTKPTRSGTLHYLLVLPWHSTKPADEVKVNAGFYQFIQPGQQVCIHNHAGAFGLPWYEVAEASNCNRPFGGPGW